LDYSCSDVLCSCYMNADERLPWSGNFVLDGGYPQGLF
jgi:hypothetical protein